MNDFPGKVKRIPFSVWRIWIDTGGTFTDCLGVDLDGQIHRAKVLSRGGLRGRLRERLGKRIWRVEQDWGVEPDILVGSSFGLRDEKQSQGKILVFDESASVLELDRDIDPGEAKIMNGVFTVGAEEAAPILAARLVTRTPVGNPLPPMQLRLATTICTNALLEHFGARTALFITKGFGDLLRIGNQQRPDLFALNIEKPDPLYETVVEVPERLAADGSVLLPVDEKQVGRIARQLVAEGVRGAAVAFLHAYRNPGHEKLVEKILSISGFQHISLSSDLAPLIRIVPRAETAVVNSYLEPVIGSFLGEVKEAIPTSTIHMMTSAGGLVGAEKFRAMDSLLSGPAGGVAGAAARGRASGFEKIIGFDMGGTSTDVARYDGDFSYRFEHQVGDAHLVAPALAIETVAAGGGSICTYEDERMRVGPESAGADPGPACYGCGGPLTMTDVNLLLGRLDAGKFDIPIDEGAARQSFEKVLDAMEACTGLRPEGDGVLAGFLELANERMAEAIGKISIREGYDPAEYALVAFGGAGGQHACAVAERLGMETIIFPKDASLLSAVGLGRAVIERIGQRQVLRLLDEVEDELEGWFGELVAEATEELLKEGVAGEEIRIRRKMIHLRLQGQDSTIEISYAGVGSLRKEFAARYEGIYGQPPESPPLPSPNPRSGGGNSDAKPIEVESIRVVVSGNEDVVDEAIPEEVEKLSPPPHRFIRGWFSGKSQNVAAVDWEELLPGMRVEGPAMVFERRSGLMIEEGWRAVMDGVGALVLRRVENLVESQARPSASLSAKGRMAPSNASSIAQQELFANRLMGIAEEMGQMLERTALSTNVKERLDFSCTILDGNGELVVNAPHMPVHLGAMGLCVRALRERVEMGPGDVAVTNHPGYGGSHLPDITVVTPVYFEEGGGELVGYVASRAHHAEMGGTRPGSMPPFATTLAEEGVVIEPRKLIEGGISRFDEVEILLRGGDYPSRAVEDNLADLRAQVAANRQGVVAMQSLAKTLGAEGIKLRMEGITDRAERLARRALADLPDGDYEAADTLDDGARLQVAIRVRGDSAVIDFTGTAEEHPGNLNATPAIVRSVVMYVLRLMIGERLPLNEGMMRAVEVVIPAGSMLDPVFPDDPALCPAVVGGNVETSQRLVNLMLKALGLAAGSQGTMNNVLFGNERVSYYETVCGGAGATSESSGAHAVHTHMTNTRITDPEVLEHRYPVRLERFAIRNGSGGGGLNSGGEGAVREMVFLEGMDLSILSQHRKRGPHGLKGGEPGAPGRQRVVRADGSVVELGAIDGCRVGAGDRLVLETPGGGGWGGEFDISRV